MTKTYIVRLSAPLFGIGKQEIYFIDEGELGIPQLVADVSSVDQLLSRLQMTGCQVVDRTSFVRGSRRITDWHLSKDFVTPWG